MPVRRVRVTRPVGEGMMPPVSGDPADDIALEAHRPGDREHYSQHRRRGETAVREAAVEAERDAEPGEGIQASHQQHVGEPDTVAPGQPQRRDQAGERQACDCRGDCHLHRTADGAGGRASVREGRHTVVVLSRLFQQCSSLSVPPGSDGSFVDVAPAPGRSRLCRCRDRVVGFLVVTLGMLSGRLIRAGDPSAGQAEPEGKPRQPVCVALPARLRPRGDQERGRRGARIASRIRPSRSSRPHGPSAGSFFVVRSCMVRARPRMRVGAHGWREVSSMAASLAPQLTRSAAGPDRGKSSKAYNAR